MKLGKGRDLPEEPKPKRVGPRQDRRTAPATTPKSAPRCEEGHAGEEPTRTSWRSSRRPRSSSPSPPPRFARAAHPGPRARRSSRAARRGSAAEPVEPAAPARDDPGRDACAASRRPMRRKPEPKIVPFRPLERPAPRRRVPPRQPAGPFSHPGSPCRRRARPPAPPPPRPRRPPPADTGAPGGGGACRRPRPPPRRRARRRGAAVVEERRRRPRSRSSASWSACRSRSRWPSSPRRCAASRVRSSRRSSSSA